jgi:hypothetical protein
MALLARLYQARHSKIEYIPLSSSASSVHVLQERMTVWWLLIPAIWLCKPTDGPLTAHPQRRNIDYRRFSEGSCCFFRTLLSVIPRAGTRTVPLAPTPNSLSKSITARTRVFWNEDPHGDCQPQNPPSILGHDPCAVCLLRACTKPHSGRCDSGITGGRIRHRIERPTRGGSDHGISYTDH